MSSIEDLATTRSCECSLYGQINVTEDKVNRHRARLFTNTEKVQLVGISEPQARLIHRAKGEDLSATFVVDGIGHYGADLKFTKLEVNDVRVFKRSDQLVRSLLDLELSDESRRLLGAMNGASDD